MHPELTQDKSKRLTERSAQSQEDTPHRIVKSEFSPPFRFLWYLFSFKHDQDDPGNGDDHPQPALKGQFFPENDPADHGSHRRRQGHQEHGYTGTDDHEGLEQAEVAKCESYQSGKNKNEPGPSRSINRQKITTVDPCEDTQKKQPYDQP